MRYLFTRSLPLLIITTLALAGTGMAAQTRDEKNLAVEAARLDKTAKTTAGRKAVVMQLTRDFGVTAAKADELVQGGLAYGEIAAIYALASQLAGGANDANVQRVRALREGPPVSEWDAVADELRVKLAKAVSRVKKTNDNARREMKKEQAARQAPAAQPASPGHRPGEARKFTGEGKSLPQGEAAQ